MRRMTRCDACDKPFLGENCSRKDEEVEIALDDGKKKKLHVQLWINPYINSSPNRVCKACRAKVLEQIVKNELARAKEEKSGDKSTPKRT